MVKQPNHLSSRDSDLLLDKADFEKYDDECADVYFFTQREVAFIYTHLRYADWEARWVNRDPDYQLVERVKRKLLMLCAKDLVKSNLAIMCALTGRTMDLGNDAAVEGFLNSFVNFSEDGVVPAIDRLSGASQEEDYTDELTAIVTVLGGAI